MALNPQPTVAAQAGSLVLFDGTNVGSSNALKATSWDFGDGSPLLTGTSASPTHHYTAAGTFTVTYTATDSTDATGTGTVAVTVASPSETHPTASFEATVRADGVTVDFVNDSTASGEGAITMALWDFGDGTHGTVADAETINHVYAAAGTYSVGVGVSDANGSDVYYQSVTVPGLVQVPTPSFTNTVTGLTVQFTDSSTTQNGPIKSWAWDFGDNASSTSQNPTHTYSAPGTYTVKLTVVDQVGTATTTQSLVLAGQAPANPQANFTVAVTNLLAQFTDTSTDVGGTIASRLWDFGDNKTSTDTNPSHIYAAAGQYTVKLTITDVGGATNAKTLPVTVGPAPEGDSYSIKAFVDYGALALNTPSQVATLGELSVHSATFARDRQLFGGSSGGSNPSSVNLTVFSAKNADGSQSIVPVDYANLIIQIGGWMYVQGLNGAFTADPAVFLQAITAQFGAQITQIQLGTMTSQQGLWWPDTLTFYFANASAVSPGNTAKTRTRLWFADRTFQNQYDEYHIEFVPPIDVLDDFFKSADVIKAEVAAVTLKQTLAKAEALAASDPYTTIAADVYNWIDPLDKTYFIPTNWTYVIWGAAGNNVDAIKAALQDYILSNSTHSRDEWAVIFPDIFQSTEVILTPLWNQYAIPNKTLDPSGMYRSVVNVTQGRNYAKETATGVGYTDQHVDNVLNVVPVAWKTLTMLAVGGPQNRGGLNQFALIWPDYLNVPTSSTDFGRMQQSTQAFVRQLFEMLKVAETMTENSDVPPQFTRLHRTNAAGDTVLYLAASFNSVQYLIVAKTWMVAKYGATTDTKASLAIGYDGTYNNGAYQLLSQNEHMALQFLGVNGQAPYTFELIDSTVSSPSIDANSGLFQGNFPAEGDYSVTLKMLDSQARGVTQTFAFHYQHPTTGQ